MPPKISVVIPTYRRPELLKKCLTALAAQTFPKKDFEVIVVSDGPDEETEAAVRKVLSGNFRYLALPQKGGPAAARNMGWRAAQGTLIAFTDDDTVPDRSWLSGYATHYNNEAHIAYTGKIVVPRPARPTDYERNTAGLETADFVTANCAVTRAALEAVGGFDERFSAAWREDSDLEFRLLEAGVPIFRLEDALVVHPVRQAPWGVSLKEQKKGVYNALLYKKFPERYRQKIQPRPALDYYGLLLAAGGIAYGLISGKKGLAMGSGAVWAALMARFIVRRLKGASHEPSHVAEMVATSVAIPYASVYWQLRGAWRYKVLFF